MKEFINARKKLIVLKSTGAIGDLVIASALPPALKKLDYKTGVISKGFTLPLWHGLQDTYTYDAVEKSPAGSLIVDISDYLAPGPHSNPLPKEFLSEENNRIGHLCEWMAYAVYQKTGIHIHPAKEDVKIILTQEELDFGKNKIKYISGSNKPVVIFAPYASTKNRNIPKSTLEEVVRGISDFAVPCLLEPYSESQYIKGTTPIGDKDLRKSASILYATDVYVGVDSGPLHMVNSVLQGTPKEINGNINSSLGKIIVVTASSNPDTVSYNGNKIIQADNACPISPCGVHGYWSIEEYSKTFCFEFYKSGIENDKSGCIFKNYDYIGTAECMMKISPEEIIENIRVVLK